MVLPLPVLRNEDDAVRTRSTQFKFYVRRLSSKRVDDIEPAGRGFFGLRNQDRFRLGCELMAGKELQAELLALRIPYGGKSSASMDRVNLGYGPPFDKAAPKCATVG